MHLESKYVVQFFEQLKKEKQVYGKMKRKLLLRNNKPTLK